MKSRTCTCKDDAATVIMQETKKTSSRKALKNFEDDCTSNRAYTNKVTGPNPNVFCELN
jgi:hypothetical protein